MIVLRSESKRNHLALNLLTKLLTKAIPGAGVFPDNVITTNTLPILA
jgi:hypothetical protein